MAGTVGRPYHWRTVINLRTLRHLVDNDENRILENIPTSVDSDATLGIARRLIGNGESVESLTDNQQWHYQEFIKPLIEDVACSNNDCGQIIEDDQTLLTGYQIDEVICQHCRYQMDLAERDD